MERLTNNKGELLRCNDCIEESNCYSDISCSHIFDALKKLAEYEDLEEQGLLKIFPCKVGDTVYSYCSEFGILSYTVDCIVFDDKITFQCSSYSEPIGEYPGECLDEIEPDITDFGKIVFLTQAESEDALERMEN